MLQGFHFPTNHFWAFVLILGLTGCAKEALLEFKVTEPIGMARDLEYIQLEWEVGTMPQKDANFYITANGNNILGQVLGVDPTSDGNFLVRGLFPIQIDANETISFLLFEGSGDSGDTLSVSGTDYDLVISNKYFTADLRANKKNPDNPLSAGQVTTVEPANVDGVVFKRNNINIHWSPNFQKKDVPYRTVSHLENGKKQRKVGPYLVQIDKEGFIDEYPEFKITSSYSFYAGMPFFIFSSEILAVKDVHVSLLRNDEMTIDSLFTHVVYRSNGNTKALPLYEESTFLSLEGNPIPDEAPWLAFINQNRKFILGCIRLDYDNNNLEGMPSPLYRPHTKITAASSNGRYWNRRLIHDHVTLVPRDSKYYERNAYFTGFSTDSLDLKVNQLHKILENPVNVLIEP